MVKHLTTYEHTEIKNAYRRFTESSKNLGWRGPSLYFHKKTIEFLSKERLNPDFSYHNLLNNERFLEYLYATLATWGLHSMKGPYMKSFNDFKNEVEQIADKLDEIKDITLDNWQAIDQNKNIILDDIFAVPRITKSERESEEGPILVANSKLLHHLHPNLFPPIDRKYIIKFFYNRTNHPNSIDKQKEYFWEILCEYSEFYRRNSELIHEIRENYYENEPITKIIDNIVVGLCLIRR